MLSFFSFLGVILASAGAALAYFQLVSGLAGAALVALGLGSAALLLLPALALLFRYGTRNAPWLAILFGLGAAALVGGGAYLAFLNPIHDVTTDVNLPPKFRAPTYSVQVKKGSEYLDSSLLLQRDYDPASAALQAQAYPELAGVVVKASPKEVFTAAMKVIREQLPQWRIVLEDTEGLHAEMEIESPGLHFVDDLALEVRSKPEPGSDSRIELRSRSREGVSDFGANIRRLRHLEERLAPAMHSLESQFAAERQAAAKKEADQALAAAIPPPAPAPAPAAKPSKRAK